MIDIDHNYPILWSSIVEALPGDVGPLIMEHVLPNYIWVVETWFGEGRMKGETIFWSLLHMGYEGCLGKHAKIKTTSSLRAVKCSMKIQNL